MSSYLEQHLSHSRCDECLAGELIIGSGCTHDNSAAACTICTLLVDAMQCKVKLLQLQHSIVSQTRVCCLGQHLAAKSA